MSQTTIDDVRALEDRRYKAMIARDFDTLRSLLHAELVYTHSNAAVDGRDSWIAGIDARRFDYRGVERFDETIRVYGDTAIVTGRIRIELVSAGTPRQLNSRYVDVWVKQGGAWQMTLWQSTPIPA